MNGVWAVVPAAGKGRRALLGMNKALYPVGGRAMILRTLDALCGSGAIDGACVVVSPDEEGEFLRLIGREGYPVRVITAPGAGTRQESVYSGLKALPDGCLYVLIHDAARPFVNAETVRQVLESAVKTGSGVPCSPVTDTVKYIREDGSVATPDRSRLRFVQTPQGFRLKDILRCHAAALEEGFTATDDAALYERYEGSVTLVEDRYAAENRKLTNPEDFAEAPSPFRVGYGSDAHRLAEGRKLVLCGVEIPYEKGLLGHSDADAALHALMDALLGAAGLRDIGAHFPDTDPRYEGISSLILLKKTQGILCEKGYRAVNCDITITAQKPRLSPYIDRMAENVREALPGAQVSVKATTTEGMGFEGRGEGISAAAAVLLMKI